MFKWLIKYICKSKHIFSTAQHQDLVWQTEIILIQKPEASNAWNNNPVSWGYFKWSQMGSFCMLYSYYQWFYLEGKPWVKFFCKIKIFWKQYIVKRKRIKSATNMEAMDLFCFQNSLCVHRKYSTMCALTPRYCTKQPRTYSPPNMNRALFSVPLSRSRNVLQWNPFC